MKENRIIGGLYLVLDPSIPQDVLLRKLKSALSGGVNVLQIWNHWPEHFHAEDKHKLIEAVLSLADIYEVPVLINDAWELLLHTALDGVHFDKIPENFTAITTAIKRPFITGITCGNSLDKISWAETNEMVYISFCAMFPSASAGACEIVDFKSLTEARRISQMPFFVSGGITIDNIHQLKKLSIDGIAVISGILSVDDPESAAKEYHQHLKKIRRYVTSS